LWVLVGCHEEKNLPKKDECLLLDEDTKKAVVFICLNGVSLRSFYETQETLAKQKKTQSNSSSPSPSPSLSPLLHSGESEEKKLISID